MEKENSFCPTSQADWRQWLEKNHKTASAVWLVFYKAKTGMPTVAYADAVDEALCFGWIDSKINPIDQQRYRQFFSPRKATSVWSKVNKDKVERLLQNGKMTAAGLKSIEIAKQNGSWTILDSAEALIMPAELIEAFAQNPEGLPYFEGLSRTDKRNILQWLVLAKKEETKAQRIAKIVSLAAQNQKPKPF
jgi:uncharacterized protein YdeI (YjbR/CyaY-like superfamily)